jgi:hypothetical protein
MVPHESGRHWQRAVEPGQCQRRVQREPIRRIPVWVTMLAGVKVRMCSALLMHRQDRQTESVFTVSVGQVAVSSSEARINSELCMVVKKGEGAPSHIITPSNAPAV